MMKVLVLGAKGMLGQAFCSASAGRHNIVAWDIDELDISVKKDVEEKIGGIDPDVVMNSAAYTDVDECESKRDLAFAVNARGVGNLAEVCRRMRAILVHISTDYIFDGEKGTPYSEDDPPRPLSAYGESKLEGELMLRRILPEGRYLLLRSQWLYGKGGKNFVDTILSRARTTTELKVVDDQFGSPTWAADLAQAILLLIELHAQGVYHIANSGVVSWHDFAKKIVSLSGLSCTIRPQSSEDIHRPARRPSFSALNCSRFERISGMKLRPWEEAVKDYLAVSRPSIDEGRGQNVGRRVGRS